MEEETSTPGRGSPESAAWFRDKMAALKLSRSDLACLMIDHGDDRLPKTIMRNFQRMANGDARVSGEMRALLGLLEKVGIDAALIRRR